ncbi:unnamed protein product [Caenorhabditis auriculariae]|uniref:Secreted protein n=1 Tax=Caenorhabditis auriculariae TaxID=2777116 RepID=A0A8S1GTN9_9PELO|nr:unnamed protein product [Caenorhabditis auriculariae]
MEKLLTLLIFLLLISSGTAADPLETVIRNVLLQIRDYGEKVMANLAIPKMDDTSQSVSFQMDRPTQNAFMTFSQLLNTCPPSLPLPPLVSDTSSTWQATHVSRRLLLTQFADIDEAIEKLSTGQQLSNRRSMSTLLRQPTDFRCVQLTVLSNNDSPFEFSYYTSKGRRSIIGTIQKKSESLTFSFGGDIELNLILAYSTSDLLIFGQSDTVPACDNYLILQRLEKTYENPSDNFQEILTALGGNSALNRIVELASCQEASTKSPPIIRPASQSEKPNKL